MRSTEHHTYLRYTAGAMSILAAIAIVLLQSSAKARALPDGATAVTSNAADVPAFMVSLTEGGSLPSEAKATCDNRAAGSFQSTAGLILEHYYPDAKAVLEQKVQYMPGIKATAQSEYDQAETASSNPRFIRKSGLAFETIDGAQGAYYTVTAGCVEDANPASTKVYYLARLVQDATYADIRVEMYASSPDSARTQVRAIMQKVKTLNYASLK